MRFSPGATFDRYVIEALLGEGGMGEVYRALDPRLQRKVALKVLRVRAEGEDGDTWMRAVALMQREARIAAALNHPNSVAIYDVGEHDTTPFIAMELVDGESLRAYIGGMMPLGARLAILRDVARALGAAHREGLVHRDIKPENVMVRSDGVVKVLDFGIARRVHVTIDATATTVESALRSTTGGGVFVGTPAYMAPEQVRGEDVDARADQFAWGVLAYELVSGRLPFRIDKGIVSLIASILNDTPPSLEGVPQGLDVVIGRALSKHPQDRYESMDHLVEELSAFITSEAPLPPASRQRSPVSVDAPTLDASTFPKPTPKPAPKPRRFPAARVAIVAAITAAVAACVVVIALRRPAPPADRTEGAPAATQKGTPTAITELPAPQSDSREALIAYREGMQALRDGAWEVARAAFDRARKLDPSLALAHLRYALATMPYEPEEARSVFQRTILQRASLSERDQGLMDAIEPFIQRNPPDRKEAAKRFDALIKRFPGDAELAFWQLRMAEDDAAAALPLADACLALDPKYSDCWQLKASALDQLGKPQEAIEALDHCVEMSFASVDCLALRAYMDLFTGRCDRLEEAARHLIALTSGSGRPYHQLAAALMALGRPDDVVRTAVHQASSEWRTAGDALTAQLVETDLSIAMGDFASVERHLKDLGLSVDRPAATRWHPDVPLYPGLYYEEIGQLKEAGKLAAALLARREGVALPDVLPWMDRTLELRMIALRGGLLTRAAYEAERAAWLRRFEGAAPSGRMEAWYVAYAMPARTADDAREALSVLPALAPLPHAWPTNVTVRGRMLLGKIYYLAGDMEAALPLLSNAGGCHELVYPFTYLQTRFRLGAAHEALGHREQACDAYRVVIDRWGTSRVSVTAKEASRRAKGLGCATKRKP